MNRLKNNDRRSDALLTVIETNHAFQAAENMVGRDGNEVRTSGRKDSSVEEGPENCSETF